jgi:excisionase family DNA binding protein
MSVETAVVLAVLLTVPQVAQQLAIGERKAWALVKSGEIKSLRIGRSVRVDPKDLAAFVERCKTARRGAS